MKALSMIALAGLLIAVGVAGYGMMEAKPDMFILAGIIAGIGASPFGIATIINFFTASNEEIK